MRTLTWAALMLLCLAILVAGCGGSPKSGTRTTGRVVLDISWPATRDIPAATRSIKVVAKVLEPLNGPQVGQVVVPRPAGGTSSQAVLTDIPSVKVRLTATAHASNDGTGGVIASGMQDIQVVENGSTNANITLAASGGGPITFTSHDPGEVPHLGFCLPGHFFRVHVEGLTNKAVTWSVTGGGVLETPTGPTAQGDSSVTLHTGHSEGTFTITATSVENSTLSASQTFIVDPMTSSNFGFGAFRGTGPKEDGSYTISGTWSVTRSGNTYAGPRIGGTPGEGITGTLVSPDHFVGSMRWYVTATDSFRDEPFDASRQCFD